MTYSIIGQCTESGALGIAVQSKFPGAGGLVPYGEAGVGCITSQAFANPAHGPQALRLLSAGALPDEIIPILLRNDPAPAQRQISVVDWHGRIATYTGEEVYDWDGAAGVVVGKCCTASGNALASATVLSAMVGYFETSAGDALAPRLIGALQAGRDAGGEKRGQQSAAVVVWQRAGGYGGWGGRHVDISVYDHPQPIDELLRCYRLHRLSYFPSDPKNLIVITGRLTEALQSLLIGRGFLPEGADRQGWDRSCIEALRRFMGYENYDNRLRDDGYIDREVLDDLCQKYADFANTLAGWHAA